MEARVDEIAEHVKSTKTLLTGFELEMKRIQADLSTKVERKHRELMLLVRSRSAIHLLQMKENEILDLKAQIE